MHELTYYSQATIDDYFDRLVKEDKKREPSKKESTATKMMRKAALNFLLNDCLNLKINFKNYSTKSESTRESNPHVAYSEK